MLGEATKTLKSGVRTRPLAEARSDGGHHALQGREVLIVQAPAAKQFPHSFDGIELRAIRRQEVQAEVAGHFAPPRGVQLCVMVTGIVADEDDLPTGVAAQTLQFVQEGPASLRVKHAFRSRHDQFAVPQAHGPEEADALARRRMPADRVGHLGRNPEAAARAVLLEMHLIDRPQVHVVSSRQAAEFFCERLGVEGPPVRPAALVCATGSRVDGRVAGIVALSASPRVRATRTRRASDHPTSEWASQTASGWCATQFPPSPSGPRLSGLVDRCAHLPTTQRNPALRNVAPSLPPCGASRRASRPRVAPSFLGLRAERRAVDGRNATCRCGGFRPAGPGSCFLDRISSVLSLNR